MKILYCAYRENNILDAVAKEIVDCLNIQKWLIAYLYIAAWLNIERNN